MEKKTLKNSSKGEPQQSQTVLIVEDDEALAGLLQRNLRRLGLEVEIALTGADAIDRMAGGRFDLALLDYRLPDMTGIKVIETLAEQKRTIPFIVTTGLGDERIAVELMKLGARDYLVKDATFLDRLPQVVERTLQELDTERRLAQAERSLLKQTQELAKRMNELRCLFSLDELMKQEGITVKQFLDRLVSFIPAAMQYPEISNACITLDGKRHKNKGFKKTRWMLQEDIVIGGKKTVSVQVCYSEERPEADIGPFLKEEGALVSSIAKQVGIYIEGRRSREALRESEERWHSLVTNAPDIIINLDREHRIMFISRTVAGFRAEDVIGKSLYDYTSPEYHDVIKMSIEKVFKTGEMVNYETLGSGADGKTVWYSTRVGPVESDGKVVSVLLISNDITERKRAEEATRESERRLREAQALGRIGSWEFDVDHGTIVWSDETYALYERDPSLGPPTPEEEATYYAPEQAAALREYARRAIEAGEELKYDLQAKLPSGRTAFFSSSMRPLRDENGRVAKLFGTVQDITERKQTELEKERLLHELDERVIELNCLYGISNVLARQYDTAEQLFQEILKVIMFAWYYSETVCARIISEGVEYRTKNFKETPWKLSSDILARGESVGAVEVYYLEKRPKADEGPFHEAERDLVNAVAGRLGEAIERKRARDALRESEERYRSVVENANESIVVAQDGILKFFNPKALELTGYSAEELGSKPFVELVHPDDRPMVVERHLQRLKGEKFPGVDPFRIVDKNGVIKWLEIAATLIDWGGRPATLNFLSDITERKLAEEALNLKNRMLKSINDYTQTIAFVPQDRLLTTIVTKLKEITNASEIIINDYDEEKSELVCLQSTLSEERNSWLRKTLGGSLIGYRTPVSKEKYEEMTSSVIGRVRSIHEVTFGAIPAPVGKIIEKVFGFGWFVGLALKHNERLVGTVMIAGKAETTQPENEELAAYTNAIANVLARRKAETALAQSEERYRDLFEEAPASVTVVDMSGVVVNCNTGTEELTGHARADILGKRFDELMTLDPRDLPVLANKFAKLASGEVGETYELEIIRKDGERRWIRVRNSLLKTGDEATGIQIYAVDITEQKMAEIEIRESEERYRDLFEGGIEGMFVMDAETMKVSLCNKRAAQIYGYESPELAIGINPLDFVHPDDKERARRLIVEDMFLKDLRQVNEFRTLTRGGEEKWISAVGTVIDYQGKPAGLVSFRDITEQKRAQEEIKRQTRRSEALYAITQAVSKTLNLDELVNEALKTTLDVIGTEAGGIYVAKFESRELVLKAHSGVSQGFVNEVGIVKLSDEELARGLKWTEPVFEPEKVFVEANLERYQRAADADGLHSIIIVPFWSKGVPVGGLVLADRRERKYSPEEIELLKAIVNEIAIGIENATLLEKTKEMSVTDELTGIYNRRHFYNELDTEIHRMQRYGRYLSIAMLDLDEFKNYNDTFGHANGDVMLRSIAQTLKFSLRKSDTVFRYGGDEFIVILPGTDAETARKVIDRIRSTWAEMHKEKHQKYGKPIGFSTGIAQFPDNANTPDGLVFLTDAALFYAKRRGGAQSMIASELNTLSPEILSMATREQVYALSATVDAKDPYTYGHSNRVAAVTETIAKSIGMSGKDLADVYAAAMLHDIGKLGVPDAILTKPGKLTDAEWKIVYQHPAEGAKIIVHVKELSRLIPMVRHHHEWYNGTGYPDRLKGDEIPLGARIISVADAYDTMTTKRLYRNTITPKEALKELKRCAGTQFDPELVESFSRSMEKDSK